MKVTLRQRQKGKNSISLYLDFYHKGNRKYEHLGLKLYVKPRTPTEREHNKRTKALAEKITAKRQLEAQEHEYGFISYENDKTDFIEYFEKLCENRYSGKSNYGNWLSALNHIKEFTGNKLPIRKVNKSWVERFREYLIVDARKPNGDPLAPNTTVSYFNKVLATLKKAYKDEIIRKDIASLVPSIKESETNREFLTYEELKKAAGTNCDAPQYKKAFLFSALTGLRFSDIQKLTWSEIQHSKDYGHYIRFRQKKTKGYETHPVSEDAIKLIGDRQGPADKVFIDLNYSTQNNEKLQEWINNAGINKKITFHCARHTYATLQLTLGTDIYTVSKLLGHKNIQTTQVYSKVINEKKKSAASKIKL